MKKLILMLVVGLLTVAFAASMVSAAADSPQPAPFGRHQNLTDAQKQELAPLFNQMKDLHKQMFEVHKQIIQKEVEFGTLTQEQADQRIARMQEMLEKGPRQGMKHSAGMKHHKMNHDQCQSGQQPQPAN